MKKKSKNQGAPGFEPGTSCSAVESSLIKNVNKSHYPYFLITCWLQSGIQAQMGNERSIYYKVYGELQKTFKKFKKRVMY